MAGTLPPTPSPGPLEWALIVLAVASFGTVAVAQAMFPLWAGHPAAASLRVHIANGFYANALVDRRLAAGRPQAAFLIHASGTTEMLMKTETMATLAPLPAAAEAVDTATRAIPPVWPLARDRRRQPLPRPEPAPWPCAAPACPASPGFG
jgi:hypothetical protein